MFRGIRTQRNSRHRYVKIPSIDYIQDNSNLHIWNKIVKTIIYNIVFH